ncbi:Flp1 family type IVb pilin [uncultured Helcococcus sp.]|uniref:Flp1 family type IVb pilin n=1 Tax=uncultured Helcococcus sp. TaxID=1072508 RepID=UPI0026277575|nr:Flp1 family type IVb pilin [uncultured Helcococcus sp.]
MLSNIIYKLKSQKGEINMIAIVLILIVVIILAVIFKDSMQNLLKSIFTRLENDINNF